MTKKGKQGAEEINLLMRKMHQESPKTIANKVVTKLDDFQLNFKNTPTEASKNSISQRQTYLNSI